VVSAVALCAACGSVARASTARAVALHVIPFPGTPDVSPASRVTFSSLLPSALRAVRVTGSVSGVHGGRITPLPAGAGTAFLPNAPFSPGETVRASAALSSPRAGSAEGDPGATWLRFSFNVESPPPGVAAETGRALASGDQPGAQGRGSGVPSQSFRSEPDLHPPVVSLTADPDPHAGDIFAGLISGPHLGPMILNDRGQLVWFLPRPTTANFTMQHYQGEPMLTWWQGGQRPEDVIMDRSYRTVAVVRAGNGLSTDPHDFVITGHGTAYLSATTVSETNLTSVGGPPNGEVIDDAVQEVDIRTGEVLWEWHTLGHVPVNASHHRAPPQGYPPFEYFHLNSIQLLPNGNLLISSRGTWSLYEISRATGRVIWTLGGKYSDFKMGPGTQFEWQHDAGLQGDRLSVFDDAATPQEERQSSAKYLRVDTKNRTVTLLRQFTHSPPLLTPEMGSVQTLPNGNVFVGWGADPQFSEYTPSGRQIFNGTFPLGLKIYRTFRFPWIGNPPTRPSLAVVRGSHGGVRVYASWNGATQVARWRVLGGRDPHDLRALGVTAPRTGFETTIEVPVHPRYFAVQALNARGTVLRTSPPTQGRR
jgi:hypothetical protein